MNHKMMNGNVWMTNYGRSNGQNMGHLLQIHSYTITRMTVIK